MNTPDSPPMSPRDAGHAQIDALGTQLPIPHLGLAPRHFEMLMRLLKPVLREFEVWVHGSRVHGGFWRMSDIDLVLRHRTEPESRHFEATVRLRRRFSDSNLPYITDVHEWAGLPGWMRDHVLQGRRLDVAPRTGDAAST